MAHELNNSLATILLQTDLLQEDPSTDLLEGGIAEIARNERQALAMLQERAYDLILSDWRLPELDGPGFYQALAQQYPHLCHRTIILTGDTLSPEAHAFFAAHHVPLLTKPVTVAAVRRAMEQVVRRAE